MNSQIQEKYNFSLKVKKDSLISEEEIYILMDYVINDYVRPTFPV